PAGERIVDICQGHDPAEEGDFFALLATGTTVLGLVAGQGELCQGIYVTRISLAVPALVVVKGYDTCRFIKIRVDVGEEVGSEEGVQLHGLEFIRRKTPRFFE